MLRYGDLMSVARHNLPDIPIADNATARLRLQHQQQRVYARLCTARKSSPSCHYTLHHCTTLLTAPTPSPNNQTTAWEGAAHHTTAVGGPGVWQRCGNCQKANGLSHHNFKKQRPHS